MTEHDLKEFIQDMQAILAPGHNDYKPEFKSGAYFILDGLQYRMKEKVMNKADKNGHVTRYSDSSLYDEVCVLCGGTDAVGDKRLKELCKAAPENNAKEVEESYGFAKNDIVAVLNNKGDVILESIAKITSIIIVKDPNFSKCIRVKYFKTSPLYRNDWGVYCPNELVKLDAYKLFHYMGVLERMNNFKSMNPGVL